jgi:hypothetical protein
MLENGRGLLCADLGRVWPMQYCVVGAYTLHGGIQRVPVYRVTEYAENRVSGSKKTPVHLKFRVYLRNLWLRLISPIEVVQ